MLLSGCPQQKKIHFFQNNQKNLATNAILTLHFETRERIQVDRLNAGRWLSLTEDCQSLSPSTTNAEPSEQTKAPQESDSTNQQSTSSQSDNTPESSSGRQVPPPLVRVFSQPRVTETDQASHHTSIYVFPGLLQSQTRYCLSSKTLTMGGETILGGTFTFTTMKADDREDIHFPSSVDIALDRSDIAQTTGHPVLKQNDFILMKFNEPMPPHYFSKRNLLICQRASAGDNESNNASDNFNRGGCQGGSAIDMDRFSLFLVEGLGSDPAKDIADYTLYALQIKQLAPSNLDSTTAYELFIRFPSGEQEEALEMIDMNPQATTFTTSTQALDNNSQIDRYQKLTTELWGDHANNRVPQLVPLRTTKS